MLAAVGVPAVRVVRRPRVAALVTGDELLTGFSRLIQGSIRTMDVACRFGGEEFAISMPSTIPADALIVAERIRAGLASTVWARHPEHNVTVSIADNGVGIAPENLTRIFAHGFTTRKDGHGFGLHSGALAAQEMGGTLTAESEGPGRGATFTLTLPISHDLTASPRTHACPPIPQLITAS